MELLADGRHIGKMLGIRNNQIVANDFSILDSEKPFVDLDMYRLNNIVSI